MSSKKEHYVCQYPGCHNRCDGNCSARARDSVVGGRGDVCSDRRRRYSIGYVYDAASSFDDASGGKCEKCGRDVAHTDDDYYDVLPKCRKCGHVFCSDCCFK